MPIGPFDPDLDPGLLNASDIDDADIADLDEVGSLNSPWTPARIARFDEIRKGSDMLFADVPMAPALAPASSASVSVSKKKKQPSDPSGSPAQPTSTAPAASPPDHQLVLLHRSKTVKHVPVETQDKKALYRSRTVHPLLPDGWMAQSNKRARVAKIRD